MKKPRFLPALGLVQQLGHADIYAANFRLLNR